MKKFTFSINNLEGSYTLGKNYISIEGITAEFQLEREICTRTYIKITDDCNLNCTYCFQKNDYKIKNEPILEKYPIIKKILSGNLNDEIVLFGGEPLLDTQYNNLKFIFDSTSNDKKIVIFTNGCFSRVIKNLLIDYKNNINYLIISLDGPKEIHNARRRFKNGDSYNEIIRNVIDLQANQIPFLIQINIDNDNIEFIEDLLNDLSTFISPSKTNILFNRVLHIDEQVSAIDFLEKFVCIKRSYPNFIIDINFVAVNKLNNIIKYNELLSSRCSLSQTKVFDMTSQNIYCCPQSKDTTIGSFSIDEYNIDSSRKSFYENLCNKTNNLCLNCEYIYFCKYGCVHEKIDFDFCVDETIAEMNYIFNNFKYFF